MADAVTDSTIAGWIQAGGVVAFATAVLLWLRDYKREVAPVFAQLVTTMTTVQTMLAALLERERARAERLAAQDARARTRMTPPSGIPSAMYEDEETTPITTIPERPFQRPRTNPGAYAMHRSRDKDGGRGEE